MTEVKEKTVTIEKTVETGGASKKPNDKKLPENSKEKLDERLDQASEESFPGSDPVSVKITK